MSGAQAAPADWSRLPPELLEQCCASLEREEDRRAALQTGAAWARAMLHAPRGPHLRWDLRREAPFAPSARALERLWGPSSQAVAPQQQQEQAGGSKGAKLVLVGGNAERLLAELRAAGVRLACVTDLEMQELTVDALVPPSLHLALPNLRSLKQHNCTLSPAAATAQLDSECSGIQHLVVSILGQAAALPAQLAQLPSLRGLTSLTLHTMATSMTFLPSLSSQLTALELDSSFRDCDLEAQQPTATWTAALRHVAQCTRLQSLALPAATAEELRPVATALTQLRHLHLNYDFGEERDADEAPELDGDAMVEALLGLTQLTSLRWEETVSYVTRRLHADRPCSWRALTIGGAGPQQLARLPLTSSVSLLSIHIAHSDSVADVQRMVSLLVGEGRPGVSWQQSERLVRFNDPPITFPDVFVHGATAADTPAALLRALLPLLAGAAEVCIQNVEWDAEAVRALPQCCRRLLVRGGCLPCAGTVAMARHLRQLESVEFRSVFMHPLSVVAYVAAEDHMRMTRALAEGGAAGRELGRRVRVEVVDPSDESGEWEQVHEAVRALGFDWVDVAVRW